MTELANIAQHAGIWPSYKDVWWNDHPVSEDTTKDLLRLLGFSADTPEEAEQSEQKLQQKAQHPYPPVRVVQVQRQRRFAAPGATEWELTDEQGKVLSGKVARDSILLPRLSEGYYDLKIKTAAAEHNCFVIVPPPACWLPPAVKKGKRVWGFSAQLYGVVSETNWGIGDFKDLGTLIKFAADQKADVVGLNPLHALFPSNSYNCSPYAPSSRLFLNFIYIDITAVDGFKETESVQKIWGEAEFQEKLTRARKSELVDYTLVGEMKLKMLQPLYERFAAGDAPESYTRFVTELGEAIQQQAIFDALSEFFCEKNGSPQAWMQWPDAYQTPSTPEVAAFATGNAERVGFFTWLQWVADSQLAAAQANARQKGMEIGLYRDLAVGSESAGAETWCNPSTFISGVTVGAPPDEYNPNGQNWGLRAFNPFSLRERRYDSFIRLLRGNMRHCRALRIDHAFGLSRMFLIPQGKPAKEGAYVEFPFDEMLAILKLESQRHQCVVIGEDLGTFPPNYKVAAAKAGLLSYKVLYFEREEDGSFRRPDHYEAQSLATLSTHDLPTLTGWLKGEDIKEKTDLNIYPSEQLLHRDLDARDRDRPRLTEAFERSLGKSAVSIEEQAQLYLAMTPCAVVTVQLEDLLGVARQVNMPTTTDERPNWKAKLPVSLEKIIADKRLKDIAKHISATRSKSLIDVPRATYRLQFHKDFTFYNAATIAPYLAKLGISHVYSSPYLQARPGSMHGYDTTDYNKLNPELGGEEGYETFCAALRANGLKQMLDFVPNHMGVGGADNAWWLSVLEWGGESPFATYFDITWESHFAGIEPKLVLPFLNDHYGDVLDRGDLKLQFDEKDGSFSVWYFQHRFCICPRDYVLISPTLPTVDNFEAGQNLKAQLATDLAQRDTLLRSVDEINLNKDALKKLLDRQHYRLAYWRVASTEINFRRFFDINDLAGIRVEDPNLFDQMHKYVLSLVEAGNINCLRIDHVDGLADPAAYCHALKERAGVSLYLAVEKILGNQEKLPEDWNIEGTSGYDALNLIGNIFVSPRGEASLDKVYRRFTGVVQSYEDMAYEAKVLIMETTLSSELQNLTLMLKRFAQKSEYTRDYSFDMLKQALKETIGRFSVYRTYVTTDHISEDDNRIVTMAIGKARKLSQLVDNSIYDFLTSILLLENEYVDPSITAIVRKFQQLTGPVMAKGVEDTAFYQFNRLISLNEVGGAPMRFGMTLKNFHEANKQRREQLPSSMIATATHDTKRGEDMRMRLHLLSERPLLWNKAVTRWRQFNRSSRIVESGVIVPSANDEYFIYQTLLGSWPNEMMTLPLDAAGVEAYLKRLEDYLLKAMREAKMHSNWNNPDKSYEDGLIKFVRQVLDPVRINPFLGDFIPIAKAVATLGMMNSLGQVTLKLTLPGVPDIYQGTEFWDYNFVDPDNRRPVDYKLRDEYLTDVAEPLAQQLLHWQDGKVKQSLIHKVLAHRAANADLYSRGTYEPLIASGRRADHVLAYARSLGNQKLVVILPIQFSGKVKADFTLPLAVHEGAELRLPKGKYVNILTDEAVPDGADILKLARDFPVLILASKA